MEMVESKEEWCEEEGEEEECEEEREKEEREREHLMLSAHNQQRGARNRFSANLEIYSAGTMICAAGRWDHKTGPGLAMLEARC